MDYLCMAVQRKVTKKQSFGSREQAREYFRENYGADCCIEEKGELKKKFLEKLLSGERQMMLHLAGIYRRGSGFWVLEETYYYRGHKSAGAEGILEVRNQLPKELTADSISLDICSESAETPERFLKKLRKLTAEARRNFRAAREDE
ncbi:MAG: hypothetical protein K1W28_08775 [Lachnospiraceae bacterium]